MSVTVLIPSPLRRLVGGVSKLSVEGKNVHEVLKNLAEKNSELRKQLFNDQNELRAYVNIYLADVNIRDLSVHNQEIPLNDGDELVIIPSISGGSEVETNESEVKLSDEEVIRYSRHLIMSEVNLDGQKKLKNAKVLCVGAGGLGSPSLLYLAAAGVGTIGIVEFDKVDLTNIQRQILYSTSDVGRTKLEAAKERLSQLNPEIQINTHNFELSSWNAAELFAGYDIVLDGSDNFPTRYLVNDMCVFLGMPYVFASVFRFEGQLSVFADKNGPCYRCFFAEPPPSGLVPSCAEGGVLGVLPGIMGTLQALEVLKLILGFGRPLIGRFITFDALEFKTRELIVKKRSDCVVCGLNPTVTAPVDYHEFCGIFFSDVELDSNGIPSISVEEYHRRTLKGEVLALIDVREKNEYEIARIPGSRLFPLSEIAGRLHELDLTVNYTISCQKGPRSIKVYHLLKKAGFKNIQILVGGIQEWSEKIDKIKLK